MTTKSHKRKKSSTNSNPVLNQSPPSVTRHPHPRSTPSDGSNQPPRTTPVRQRLVEASPPLPPPRPRDLQPLAPPLQTTPTSIESNPNNRLQTRVEEEVENDDSSDESSDEDIGEAEGGVNLADYNSAEEDQAGEQTSLVALLTAPGRDDYLQRLSPHGPGLWFDRDDTLLVSVISNLIQDKFSGPWYSWRKTPNHIRDGFFVQLAHRYTWDPIITPLVREQFDKIAKRRLKGMVSYVRKNRHRKKPNWIRPTLWARMVKYFDSKEARKRSRTTSNSRNSDRGGLGPHKHVSGPKSHVRLQKEMEMEEGRPVSLGEVFIKAHTKKDGTIVDQKAKKVSDVYSEKMAATLSQLEPSSTSDGASQAPQLTVEQKDAIFFESTTHDARGNPYGIGRLGELYHKGKRSSSLQIESPVIVELKSELDSAKQKIKEQAEYNMMLFKYLKEKDPDLPPWMEPQSSATQPATTLPASNAIPPQNPST